MKDINWGELPFGYVKTDYNVRCYYKNGKWGELEISSEETVNLHIAATALHYGQESFEGLKAFKGKDGKVRLFRWEENAKRMRNSARGIRMAEVPDDIFISAVKKVIELNDRFVPPYGSGASLYLRPLLIGSGAQVGVKPASEYMFMIFVSPVGPYFKEGFKPVKMKIEREYDRAAPLGTGSIKVGGNYAASLNALHDAHEEGYASSLFLDAREKKYIDEAGPANFFGIKNNTYVTPKSDSILPSITNMSLIEIAKDMGMAIERRPIEVEELATFEEAGACGTAAVISPIGQIDDVAMDKSYVYSKDGEAGKVSKELYKRLQGIQMGDIEDKFAWVEFV